eukprot:m.118463 g.118463  ORF g.118463 m.118463 type:complete len:1255 (+) comp13655_c0_seq2:86-3850(+)
MMERVLEQLLEAGRTLVNNPTDRSVDHMLASLSLVPPQGVARLADQLLLPLRTIVANPKAHEKDVQAALTGIGVVFALATDEVGEKAVFQHIFLLAQVMGGKARGPTTSEEVRVSAANALRTLVVQRWGIARLLSEDKQKPLLGHTVCMLLDMTTDHTFGMESKVAALQVLEGVIEVVTGEGKGPRLKDFVPGIMSSMCGLLCAATDAKTSVVIHGMRVLVLLLCRLNPPSYTARASNGVGGGGNSSDIRQRAYGNASAASDGAEDDEDTDAGALDALATFETKLRLQFDSQHASGSNSESINGMNIGGDDKSQEDAIDWDQLASNLLPRLTLAFRLARQHGSVKVRQFTSAACLALAIGVTDVMPQLMPLLIQILTYLAADTHHSVSTCAHTAIHTLSTAMSSEQQHSQQHKQHKPTMGVPASSGELSSERHTQTAALYGTTVLLRTVKTIAQDTIRQLSAVCKRGTDTEILVASQQLFACLQLLQGEAAPIFSNEHVVSALVTALCHLVDVDVEEFQFVMSGAVADTTSMTRIDTSQTSASSARSSSPKAGVKPPNTPPSKAHLRDGYSDVADGQSEVDELKGEPSSMRRVYKYHTHPEIPAVLRKLFHLLQQHAPLPAIVGEITKVGVEGLAQEPRRLHLLTQLLLPAPSNFGSSPNEQSVQVFELNLDGDVLLVSEHLQQLWQQWGRACFLLARQSRPQGFEGHSEGAQREGEQGRSGPDEMSPLNDEAYSAVDGRTKGDKGQDDGEGKRNAPTIHFRTLYDVLSTLSEKALRARRRCAKVLYTICMAPSWLNTPVDGRQAKAGEQSITSSQLHQNTIVVALSIEGIATVAKVFQTEYKQFLVHSLYRVMAYLTAPSLILQAASRYSLHSMSAECGHKSVAELVAANADYLVHHIGINLRLLSLHAEAPFALHAMLMHAPSASFTAVAALCQSIFTSLDGYLSAELMSTYLDILHAILRAMLRWSDDLIAAYHPPPVKDGDDPPPPKHIALANDIIKRVLVHMDREAPTVRRNAVMCLSVAMQVLGPFERQLLPAAHRIWKPLTRRFNDQVFYVQVESIKLLGTLSTLCATFLRQRVLSEALPQILKTLKLCSNKFGPETSLFETHSKLASSILSSFEVMWPALDPNVFELDTVVRAVTPYLSADMPKDIQVLAGRVVQELADIDHYVVWFALIQRWYPVIPHAIDVSSSTKSGTPIKAVNCDYNLAIPLSLRQLLPPPNPLYKQTVEPILMAIHDKYNNQHFQQPTRDD